MGGYSETFYLVGLSALRFAGTGSMYRLTPNDINAELKTNASSHNKNKDELYLAVVLRPNANWTKIGELEKTPADK